MTAERKRLFAVLKPLITGIARALGSHCEVVLHDFSDTERSIIAIENGYVTGRQVGDGVDELGIQLLREGAPEDLFNYRGYTKDGKALRSSSIFLRDDRGEPYGAICINIDITPMMTMSKLLSGMMTIEEPGVQETFEANVHEVLAKYIDEGLKLIGKEVAFMDKADKLRFLRYLEDRGAFLIRYSVDRVAAILDISRYTLYSYLEEARQKPAPKSDESVASQP